VVASSAPPTVVNDGPIPTASGSPPVPSDS
jgi:hypothetical protein